MRYRFSFCFSLLISITRVVLLPAQNNPSVITTLILPSMKDCVITSSGQFTRISWDLSGSAPPTDWIGTMV